MPCVLDSAAQTVNGGYIVWAFGFPSRAGPHLGVCDPESSNTDAQVGGVSGYLQVEEVDTLIGFMGRAKLNVPMDCVDVWQYVFWVCVCGVVDKEYTIHVSSVKGEDLGVNKVLYDGFFKM